MSSKIKMIVCTLLGMILISGCSKETTSFTKDKNVTLDVGYTKEEHFKQRYSALLEDDYPNLRVNVVSTKELLTPDTNPVQWVKENQVDLIYLPSELMDSFVQEGLLADIGPLIQKDDFDLERFIPSVIELTKAYGNGKIYGLPTNFYGSAIVYNKDLFDKYKIQYPEDQMTWESILLLSSKFPSTDSGNIKGISLKNTNLLDLILHIGQTSRLKAYDHQQQQVSFNGESWIPIWENAIQAYTNGALDINADQNSYLAPFLAGERAMAVVSYDDYKRLEQEKLPFDWSTVTMAIDPAQADQSDSIRVPGFFAILNSSDDLDAAWELLKFFSSEDVARWEYRSDYGFSSLLEQVVSKVEDREKVTPFYKLSPRIDHDHDLLPNELLTISQQTLDQILNHTLSVQEGLNLLQTKADQELKRMTPRD